MFFKTVKVKNFFSFGPERQKVELSKPGLFLITGKNEQTGSSNGAGKSSILDAICFALFGRVTKDVNLPDIVNEQSGADCEVELNFEIGNVSYWIVRYRKHKKFYDNVYLYRDARDDDHLISKSEKRDTQEIINGLIKFNYKSFINSVMMSQENIQGFLQTDQFKKKEIIENILQLNVITKYHAIFQLKRKLAKKQLDSLEMEVQNYTNLIENTKQTMISYVESCKKQKKQNEEEIIKLGQELENLNKLNIDEELDKIRKAELSAVQIEQKMMLYQQYADRIKSFEKEKDNYQGSQLEYRELLKTNAKTIKQLAKDLDKIEEGIKTLEDKIEEVNQNPELCPVCKNKINEQQIKFWLNEQDEKKTQLTSENVEKKKTLNTLTNQSESWKTKDAEIDALVDEIQTKIDSEAIDAEAIKKGYESIKIVKTKNEDELNKLAHRKTEISLLVSELIKKKPLDKEYLNSLRKQAEDYQTSWKQKNKELKALKKKLLIVQWWEDSLSSKKNSMKSWCVNNINGYFNARIKFYMDRFFDGSVSVQVDNDLNEKVSFKDRSRTFGQFSGGEKQRLNLAILFALYSLVKANVSTKINIMFLDEILSTSLDDKGISTVLELLEEMKQEKQTVYVIDHRDNFKDYPSFENILVVKDKNGFSHIHS